jgi:putative transposase
MNTFARLVSIAAHPFVTVGLMAGVSAARIGGRREAVSAIALVAVLVIAPVAGLMRRQVREQRWQNADASNPAERPILFVFISAGLIALVVYAMLTHSRSFLLRGSGATLAMMVACAVITPWVKVSLHVAFASLAATTLMLLGSPVGWILLALIPVLAWSRLHLSRHRPVEIVLGLIVGTAAGLSLLYI